MDRILINTGQTLTVVFSKDGIPSDLDALPTVTIVDANGANVTSGTATDATGAGAYQFNLPAQAELKRLTVTWTGNYSGVAAQITTHADIVGAFYFSIAELSVMDGCQGKDLTQYIEARQIAESTIETYCEVAFVPRYARELHSGNNRDCLLLDRMYPRTLIAVSVDGSPQTLTGWTLNATGLLRTGGSVFIAGTAGENVTVEYTYGLDFPPPDLKRAALRYARHVLLTELSTVPDRANLMTTEFATFRLQTADEMRDRPTGLPEVDAVLNRYRDDLPAIA